MLIKYKWEKLRIIVQAQSMIFFAYLFAIMIHANYFTSTVSILPLIAFLIYLVSFELFTIKVDYRSSYFDDVWNTLDLIFLVLLGVYIVQFFRIEEKGDGLPLLAIVNLVSWIRGLSQLRCFESTRVFI